MARQDELQREIWQYRRIWLTLIILLIGGRFLLPHLRLLRGWEQKFSLAVVETGKAETPEGAMRVIAKSDVIKAFPELKLEPRMFELQGPILTSAWRCDINSEKGACLRYIWKEHTMTLAIVPLPSNKHEVHDPFTKSGWNGYLVLHNHLSLAMVSSLDTDEIKAVWPYAH
jgi:hypothetical protein